MKTSTRLLFKTLLRRFDADCVCDIGACDGYESLVFRQVLPNAVNTVVWYRLEAKGPQPRWKKYDFGKEAAGTGLEMTAIDIDGDGDTDLVCPGKSGLYLFENLSRSK